MVAVNSHLNRFTAISVTVGLWVLIIKLLFRLIVLLMLSWSVTYHNLIYCTFYSPPCSDQGKFKRIPVFRDPKGGYGFAPPYEFDSLVTLVLYYATNTMEKHNPDLETVLKFPAFTSTL